MHYIEVWTYAGLFIYIGICVFVLNSHRMNRVYYYAAEPETEIRYTPFIFVQNLTIQR